MKPIEFKFPLKIQKYKEGYYFQHKLNDDNGYTIAWTPLLSKDENSQTIRKVIAESICVLRELKRSLERLHRIEESPAITAKLSDKEYAELINQKGGRDEDII